jgi:hypothetical protein
MSLLTWLKKRRAERVLRKYGVCPKHFKDLGRSMHGGYSDWCPDCFTDARELEALIKHAAIENIKALKVITDGRGHKSRTVPPEQGS